MLQLERLWLMQRLTSLNLLIQNVIISIYLLCMGGHSLISDQEDESIWKILAMQS